MTSVDTRFICIGLTLLFGATLALIAWNLFIRRPALEEPKGKPSPPLIPSETYLGLRSQALNYPPEQFDIKPNSDDLKVYGVVMDWDVGRGVSTTVSFVNGDASMYTSSGGGVLGGGGHEGVRRASAQFVQKAQQYLDKAVPSDDTTLPSDRGVKFFLLTPKGRFIAKEDLANFENGSSSFLDLFRKANEVITELREISEDMNEHR